MATQTVNRPKIVKKETSSKQMKAKSIAKTVEETPVVVVEQVKVPETPDVGGSSSAEVIPEMSVECHEMTLADKITGALGMVSGLISQLKLVEAELKCIKITYQKEHKKYNKSPKRKTVVGNHGILEESKITPELAEFLKLDKNISVKRPQVTKAIGNYVRENNLANPENKRIFKTDDKLKKILGEPRFLIEKKNPALGEGYSYFNLQSYLKPHFIKH